MTCTSDTTDLRKCDRCGGEMKLIGRLPRRTHHPSKTVFRCAACDHVMQEQG